MKCYTICMLLCGLLITTVRAQSISLEDVHVIDVRTGDIQPNRFLTIKDGRIHSISNESSKNVDHRINCSGKYVIPGLWDMHAHLSMLEDFNIPLLTLAGITGVRDMGGDWTKIKEWKNRAETDLFIPKIYSAGPILESPRFYMLLRQLLGPTVTANRIPVGSPNEAKSVVDSLSELGVDFIKIRTVQSPEIFKSIAEACKKNGLRFTGHIDQNIGIDFALEQGLASIEHDFFPQVLNDQAASRMTLLGRIEAERPAFTPTFVATKGSRLLDKSFLKGFIEDTTGASHPERRYLSPSLLENWAVQFKLQAFEAPLNWDSLQQKMLPFIEELSDHSLLLAGSDVGALGVYPGKGLIDELFLMKEKLGLSHLEVLQAATLNAVEFLEISDQVGLIELGMDADLLVLDGNPLIDLDWLSDPYVVVVRGAPMDRQYRSGQMDKIQRSVEQAFMHFQPKQLYHLNEFMKGQK